MTELNVLVSPRDTKCVRDGDVILVGIDRQTHSIEDLNSLGKELVSILKTHGLTCSVVVHHGNMTIDVFDEQKMNDLGWYRR